MIGSLLFIINVETNDRTETLDIRDSIIDKLKELNLELSGTINGLLIVLDEK